MSAKATMVDVARAEIWCAVRYPSSQRPKGHAAAATHHELYARQDGRWYVVGGRGKWQETDKAPQKLGREWEVKQITLGGGAA